MHSVLSIDFETRSTVNLTKTGVYPYAANPHTGIWCMAYAFDDEPVDIWVPGDLGGGIRGIIPQHVVNHVLYGKEIRAWNAQFERIIWNEIMVRRYGFPPLVLEQVYDTAADAAALALPRALEKAARVLGLETQKDMDGHRLMMQMAKPRRPPKSEPDRLWWWDDEDRRERLYAYCKQDVETERGVAARIRKLSKVERAVYLQDQRMNDRGVMIDVPLVVAAQEIVAEGTFRANKELGEVTGGDVVSVTKVKDLTRWLQHRGMPIDNVRKDTLRDLLGEDIPKDVRRALELRASAGKTSTAKLAAMLAAAGEDERARGLLLYHGASTGRWSGKLLQPQNFPRPTIKDMESYIPTVLDGNYDCIDTDHPPIVVISSLLRSMLRTAPGHRFMSGDYGQIEARVLAWIAGQDDLVALFARGGKVYEDMAAFIYNVPIEEIEDGSEERQIGKNAILGAGFQMGADRFAEQVQQQTGVVLDRGGPSGLFICETCDLFTEKGSTDCYIDPTHHPLPHFREDMAEKAINGYREKNFKIKMFWTEINSAALRAVGKPGTITTVGRNEAIRFVVRGQFLWCQLPSKRFLAYAKPEIRDRLTPWGEMKPAVSYMGVNSMTRQWRRHDTYGGHLTENVVQAMARDLMAGAMLRLEDAGYRPLLTVHDEIICEPPEGHGSMEEFLQLMTVNPRWAEGLPIAADGWEGERYRK